MSRPVTSPTEKISLRTPLGERSAIRRLAFERGMSQHQAALEALRTGLLMQEVIGLAVGSHVVIPGSENCVLCLSAGKNDAAKLQAVIDYWTNPARNPLQ